MFYYIGMLPFRVVKIWVVIMKLKGSIKGMEDSEFSKV